MPTEKRQWALLLILISLLFLIALIGFARRQAEAHPGHGHIPPSAKQYRRQLVREVRYYFGLSEPVSRFAAQIHQESAWRSGVCSKYACGLAQFTEGTAKDMAKMYPKDLEGRATPLDAPWAIRAAILYMKKLRKTFMPFGEEAHAAALVAYNGGSGWLLKERRQAALEGFDPQRWWDHVEHVCLRAIWACEESRNYPRKILFTLWPLYQKAGW